MSLHRSMKGLALVLAVASAGAAGAQVVNGSFEQNGNYSQVINGWATYGFDETNRASGVVVDGGPFTADTKFFADPTDGSYQAHMSSNTDGTDGEPDTSGRPYQYSATGTYGAEDFLGVAHGALAAAADTLGIGSTQTATGNKLFRQAAMKQTVHLKAGDKISFDYQMLTLDFYKSGDGANSSFDERPVASADDFGFFSVSGGGLQKVTKLIDVFYGYQSTGPGQSDFNTGFSETPFDNDTLIGDIYFMQTPYLTYTFTAATEADYTLGFGISDAFTGSNQGNSGRPSGLSIDNVRLTPVPEPASMVSLGLGAAALLRRRKRA